MQLSMHDFLIIINGERVKRGRTRKKKNKERITKDKKRFISQSNLLDEASCVYAYGFLIVWQVIIILTFPSGSAALGCNYMI